MRASRKKKSTAYLLAKFFKRDHDRSHQFLNRRKQRKWRFILLCSVSSYSIFLFVQYFIKIHQLIGDHRPGSQLRRRQLGISFRLADGDQLLGLVGSGRVMLLKLVKRAANDRNFFGPKRPG